MVCGARGERQRDGLLAVLIVEAKLSRMIARAKIQQFVDAVVARFSPAEVILFGSYADGDPVDDSDVDILVLMPGVGSPVAMATQIRLACPRTFPMDLLVRDTLEFQQRVRRGDPFFTEVARRGVKLYEAVHAGLGREGRS